MNVLNQIANGEVYAEQTRYLMAKAQNEGASPTFHFEASADLPEGTVRVEGQTVRWSMDVRKAIFAYERHTRQFPSAEVKMSGN